MFLSDKSIHEYLADNLLEISPIGDVQQQVQPASFDVRLGPDLKWFRSDLRGADLDLQKDDPAELMDGCTLEEGQQFRLRPGEFLIARTLERVKIPPDLACKVEGLSSLARLGLQVHATGGFVDPGFEGTITLEMSNQSSISLLLYLHMRIAQLGFVQLTTPAERPYGHPSRRSKYQGQVDATPSRAHHDVTGRPKGQRA